MRRLAVAVAAACAALAFLTGPVSAALPGKNGKIAFSAYRDGNMDVYTVNADGSGFARLTSDPAWESDPAWSPDGRQIAFNQIVENVGAYIGVMDADGANQRRVYLLPEYSLGRPSWSPDGAEMAISLRYAYNEIYRIRADGQGFAVQVTRHDYNQSSDNPAWSPDGTRIAFGHYDSRPVVSSYDLRVVNASGGGEVDLTPTPTEYEMMPNWAPDGQRIAIGDEVSDVGIRLFDPDGGNRAVVPGSSRDTQPAFSPDGVKLVASTWIFEAQHSMLVTYKPDGSERILIPGTERAEAPDWQPIPPPLRTDYKNAAAFCKAERDYFGELGFRERYGGGANANAKCVSRN